ncbi:MAG TPA: chemotaxis protein CheB [Candidatus Udaeobacter sp.]|jgi:two-component system CheB/CheR fusion protein|nr:chemotaxis protein CheB [Candidatus Udaeobacter sp.]
MAPKRETKRRNSGLRRRAPAAAGRRPSQRKHGRTHPDGAKSKKKSTGCPIVGIGGSAGGFEAAMELLQNLPPSTGMAFVIVQHLDPHHASRLANLLGKVTAMPVSEIAGTTTPKPNTVYVQPPNKCVIAKDGVLTLIGRTERLNVAIDHFFESLAEECGPRAIGIVLSGTGSDGTAGLRAIKAAGGLTFAQTEQSAKFDAMPRSAIRSGFVDLVFPPHEIAREIRRIAGHPYIRRPPSDPEEIEKATYRQADDLGRIFLSLKKQMGVDFSAYKETTLLRRIQRRMALHRIDKLNHYARFLRDNKKEVEALFGDLLINVTRFFRDQQLFRALKKRFLPSLFKNKSKDRQPELRVWVPGCATGEEVYSLAICILEALGNRLSKMRIQIFGTDLSESVIEHARAGIYPGAIEKDVSQARLKRFFVKRDGSYQIHRNVRDICTFARQNITADPPFSRLDLISCRNVLIYLSPQLHKRCIPQFHYAINPGGYLILGPAESVGFYHELFELVDKRNKIYAKKKVTTPHDVNLVPYQGLGLGRGGTRSISADSSAFNAQLLQIADRIMLGVYAPAAVVIDREMHVQQFRGRTDLFLEHAPGPASLNLLQLVRPSLVADLRSTIQRSIKTDKPARKERALVKLKGRNYEINIEVVPFKVPASDKPWFLIIFDETTKGIKLEKFPRALGKKAGQREVTELRRELAASKESLQAIIEEQEATNEELKSANEEIESSNEELQSTNEELETAKEELQSTNEELTTLNEELSNRNLEMMLVTGELNNLLASIQLPIVMVDNALTVRRATPAARGAFNILPTDIGRPLSELRPNIDIPDLDNILRDVIETLSTRDRKVIDKEGHQYSLRIRPYRTTDNKIDGAVLTLVDIDGTKERDAAKTRNRTKDVPSRK